MDDLEAAAYKGPSDIGAIVQVGQAPRVMFYVFGSTLLGSLLHTTANGSQAASSVQAGLQRWTDDLRDSAKVSIMRDNYCSCDDSVDQLRKKQPEIAAQLFPADKSGLQASDFNVQGFLVRLLQIICYNVLKLFKLWCQVLPKIYAKQLDPTLIHSNCFLCIFTLGSFGVVAATIHF